MLDLLEGLRALDAGWRHEIVPSIAEACVTAPRDGLDDLFELFFTSDCTFSLVTTIRERIIRSSAEVAQQKNWASCERFWNYLAARFTLTLATLNYDTVLESALNLGPEHMGMIPVEGGKSFRLDHRVLAKEGEHRLLHIHGDVHLGYPEFGAHGDASDTSFHELRWRPKRQHKRFGARRGQKVRAGEISSAARS